MFVFSAGVGREWYRVPAGGGVATPIGADGANEERNWPFFPPDGMRFVYFGRPQKPGIYVASIDAPTASGKFARCSLRSGGVSRRIADISIADDSPWNGRRPASIS